MSDSDKYKIKYQEMMKNYLETEKGAQWHKAKKRRKLLKKERKEKNFFEYLPIELFENIILNEHALENKAGKFVFYDMVCILNSYKSVSKHWASTISKIFKSNQLVEILRVVATRENYNNFSNTEFNHTVFDNKFTFVETEIGTEDALKLLWMRKHIVKEWNTHVRAGRSTYKEHAPIIIIVD
jgi:hypothetical protein